MLLSAIASLTAVAASCGDATVAAAVVAAYSISSLDAAMAAVVAEVSNTQ